MCILAEVDVSRKKKYNLEYGPVQAKMAESNENYSVVILPLTSVSTGERHAISEIAHQDFTIFIVKHVSGTVHIDSFPQWKRISSIEKRKKIVVPPHHPKMNACLRPER